MQPDQPNTQPGPDQAPSEPAVISPEPTNAEPVTSEPMSTAPAPEAPTPVVSAHGHHPKRGLIITLIVVILLIIGGAIALALHKTSKPADTTSSTKKSTTVVGNADTNGAVIKGVELDASLKSGYSQQTLQASDLTTVKQQIAAEGLSDVLTVNGSTSYGTTKQQNGNGVVIYWGTTGPAYSKAVFDSKYNAYTAQTYQKAGLSVKNSTLPSIDVKTTSGKSYSLPCSLAAISGTGINEYAITCQGTLGSSKAFVAYFTISNTQAEAQSALSTFVAGSKIEY